MARRKIIISNYKKQETVAYFYCMFEQLTLTHFLYIWIAIAIIIFPVQLFVSAPYGRHTKTSWGPMISNQFGWFIMEVWALVACWFFYTKYFNSNRYSLFFVTLYTLHYIHRKTQIESAIEIREKIYWGGNFESIVLLADTNQISSSDIRFFLGYSGWGPGQLETELEEDSWIVCDYVTDELLFDTEPGTMWKKALENMGGRFSVYSNYPVDPNLN